MLKLFQHLTKRTTPICHAEFISASSHKPNNVVCHAELVSASSQISKLLIPIFRDFFMLSISKLCNVILIKNIMKQIILFIVGILLVNCTSPDPPALSLPIICDNTNTAFQQLYNPLNNAAFPQSLSGYANSVTHEYTFNVTNAATICSIGYQSQSSIPNQSHTIEIYDTVTSIVVSTITNAFSATTTSYVPLSSPVVLVTGRSYKIKRHSQPSLCCAYGAGRCVSNTVSNGGNVSFPRTFGNLTITDSDFYSGNTNSGDNKNSLPFIDIVFQ
jgi:hypothetical protein